MRADTQGDASKRIGSDRIDEKSCVELVESVNSIILRWNADFLITYVNDYGERFFGYRRDELIGRSVIGTIVPETSVDGADMAEMMRSIFRHPERYVNNENENLRKDGSRVWVSWTNRAVTDGDGRVAEILSIGNDITDRKQMEKDLRRARDELEARVLERTRELQASNDALLKEIREHRKAEEALRESESRFRKMVDCSPIPVAIYDVNEKNVFLNEKFVRTFGYTAEDVPYLYDWWPRAYPNRAYRREVVDRWSEHVEKASCGTKEIQPMEARVTCKDGSARYVEFSGAIIGNMILVTLQDITERKQAEDALRGSEARLHSIFRAAPTGIGLVMNRVITEANARLCEMTGYAREELIGENARMLYPTQEDYDFVGTEKYHQISERGTGTVETRWLHKEGYTIDILLSSTPIDPGNLSAGVTFTALDITERKQAERALEHAKAQAELYVDLMGHDISNMNQAIMGYLELAELTIPMEPEQRELIDKPLEIINHTARLIDNVRKLERVQQGIYGEKVVDVCELIDSVAEEFSRVGDRCVTINCTVPETCQVVANDILRDVFSNIVENAIRHSSGPVVIDIAVEPLEAGGRKYFRASVADNGPGIPDEQKRRVFSFMQGYQAKPGRRGLGLCLVKTLVEHFDGRVWVENRVPEDYRKGAKFIVELPAS